MDLLPAESRVITVLEAIKNDKKLSVRAAAKIYNVSDRTIRRRRDGHPARRDTPANSNRLTNLEEKTIIQYILELNSRSFPPRLSGVEDMANQLLRVRDTSPISKNWASNFVRRQPELRTRYAR
jgi:hypothetical protein